MTVHVPILLQTIVDALVEPFEKLPEEAAPHWLVDCTFGGGGHTAALLQALNAPHGVIAFDQDEGAIERGLERFSREVTEGRLKLIHLPFSQAAETLSEHKVLGLMADLGFSSDQIEDPARGLSFLREGPLDMRFDSSHGQSAYEYLSHATESEVAQVILELGEERFSRKIASAIVRARSEGGLPRTTTALADLIVRSVPSEARRGRIHAATRTFQALRIYVNRELEELDQLLEKVLPQIEIGGRVAVLSFHSLEDRKVKQYFKHREGLFRQVHKKPIEADESEVALNPRSRSAKLRIAERKAHEGPR